MYSQETPSDTSATAQLYLITKNDGTEYIGKILSDDGREVLILTESLGKIYIPKSEIKSITKIEDEAAIFHGEYRQEGPFTTRYAFTTNAMPIKKGENYALINLYGPEVHFAVSDNLSIGVMSTWIASPLVLAAKYTVKKQNENNINFSIGTLMGSSGYLNNFRGYGGLHFANLTFGDRMKNITLSGGYAYIQPGFNNYNSFPAEGTYINEDYPYYDYGGRSRLTHGPIFSIAGITKAGARASFVFDSMIGFFMSNSFTDNATEITPSYYNPNPPYDYVPATYEHNVTYGDRTSIALFLMPGMRFQNTDRRAFQVSLAGVSVFKLSGFNNSSNYSFPFPMCTWFFKF